ncbi:hypothetical protein [unidentified bacterial endosymbiont]|nr:hypothetical protein [unidentified bacterial endosymbiont]
MTAPGQNWLKKRVKQVKMRDLTILNYQERIIQAKHHSAVFSF